MLQPLNEQVYPDTLRQHHKCHSMPVEYMLLESAMDGKCSLLQKKHRPTSVQNVQFAKDKSMHCAISERIEIQTSAIRIAQNLPFNLTNLQRKSFRPVRQGLMFWCKNVYDLCLH